MLTKNAAMLLVLKLAEFVIQDVKRIKFGQSNLDANRNKTSDLTQKDIDCIQYLGGSVIHTLYRKVRNSKNYATLESQQIESILLSARKDDDSEQNLVREVNRGGLWAITATMQEIFMIAEKTFREITEDKDNNGVLSKIDATDMVSR